MAAVTSLSLPIPRSKSLTQRALFIAALRPEATVIATPLDCDDSRRLSELCALLGARIDWDERHATVTPAARLTAPAAPVPCGNAGTAVRFGACLSLLCDGALGLDGDEHMRARPIGPLATSLGALGVEARYLGRAGSPPVVFERLGAHGRRFPEVLVRGAVASIWRAFAPAPARQVKTRRRDKRP